MLTPEITSDLGLVRDVNVQPDNPASAILYIASRLPELSETFVYREFLGLRARGRSMISASIRKPKRFDGDAALSALAEESFEIYTKATALALPLAVATYPGLALGALRDAASSDHASARSRLKHVMQALAGISAGWRLRHLKIGHVHAHMAHVPATVGLYVARALGAKFSFTGHAADLFVDRSALEFKLKHAAFVSCISRWHRRFYQNVTLIASKRLPIIRCSVEIPQTIQLERSEIVTVARLVAKKGIDLLIDAFAAADVSGWTLRIIGDGPERGMLEALAKQLDVVDRVVFEGPQPHARCLEAIAHAGVFVLPCRTAANGDKDGIPVVLMEAMAASRAVIAGRLPAIQELIQDNVSGVLVAPNDSEILATAICRLAGDVDLRRTLGTAARLCVETEFSDEVNLDRLCAAFDHAKALA